MDAHTLRRWRSLKRARLAHGGTAYVTLEPCAHHGKTPPCADALITAGIARVVGAIVDPDSRVDGQGFGRLASAGVSVTQGVCEAEARTLERGLLQCAVAQKAAGCAQDCRKRGRLCRRCWRQQPLDHIGCGSPARSSPALAPRGDLDGHRYGARGRSAAHLPLAGTGGSLSGAGRAGHTAAASAVIAARAHRAKASSYRVHRERERRRGACRARCRDRSCRQGPKRPGCARARCSSIWPR